MENRYLYRAKRIDNGEWVIGYEAFKTIINALPDGYLIPFERE